MKPPQRAGASGPAGAPAHPRAPNPPKRSVERVSFDALDLDSGASRQVSLPRLGYDLERWLLVLLALYLVAVVVYGCLSYPQLSEIKAVAEPGKVGDLNREMVTEWRQNVRGFLDPVVPPLLALISSVIGYIFGRQKNGD
jgi:hypothetical protein